MGFVHVINKALKEALEEKGYACIGSVKIQEKTVWAFVCYMDTPKILAAYRAQDYFISKKLRFGIEVKKNE